MARNSRADLRQLLRRNLSPQHANYETEFSLRSHPVIEPSFGHWSELDLKIQFVGSDDQIFLERREVSPRRNFDQHRQSQGLVDHRLPNVQDADTIVGKYF